MDVVLKAGYSWISGDATNSPNGAYKGSLTLAWILDFKQFGELGAMGRYRLKVKSERAGRTITRMDYGRDRMEL